MCLYMSFLRLSSPRLAEPDGRRREVGDAREQPLVIALLQLRDRVEVAREGALDRAPVSGGERALGDRQELELLLAHVLPVKFGEGIDRLLELASAGRPALLEEKERALELADEARALLVLLLQLVDELSCLRRARGDAREEVLVLLRMMQPLRILVDVAQHAAQHLEARPHSRVLRHARKLLEPVQHRGDRAVLALENGDSVFHASSLS